MRKRRACSCQRAEVRLIDAVAHLQTFLIPAMWIAWLIYWKAAAGNVKPTIRREPVKVRCLYTGLLVAGASLFTIVLPRRHVLWEQMWPQTELTFWLGVLLMALGFAFTAWARVTLGRNWSSTVTLKENHELIQTGPYGWVRHPIYTGLLVMFLGTAVTVGQWRGLPAIGLILVSFLIKLRLEEQWMTELFGPQYEAYRRRVAMLVPWVW
jgi:protein-S-isoprenylcysteine O-methyltransferase Ste14